MTYEITNMDLHLMYRNRPGPILRHRSRSVVWPRRGIPNCPHIPPMPPRKPHADILRDAFLKADAANKRTEDFIGELNGQRGVGDVVQPPVMPTRGHWGQINIDGKRKAPGRSGNDVRDVDRRDARATAKTRWKACKNRECSGWFTDNCDMCLDRQRAGRCPTLARSGGGSNARRDAILGG